MNETGAFEPELNDDYAPNPVQQEFLRLAGLRYWYLALGESNHAIPHINAFIAHTKTVAAVTGGRRKNIFLESSVKHQGYLDSLRIRGRFDRAVSSPKSGWLAPDANRKLRDIFERAAQDNPDARFIAADTRNIYTIAAKSLLPLAGWICVRAVANFLSIPAGVFSQETRSRFRVALSQMMGSAFLYPLVLRATADDRNTVRLIKAFEGPAVLEFGTAHLMGGFDRVSARRSMRTLLPEEGKALCVMNVYHDVEHRNEHRTLITGKFPGVMLPDADLLVRTAGEDCYGVRVNNPALQPLFNEAVRNVVLRMANGAVTAPRKGRGGYIQVRRGLD